MNSIYLGIARAYSAILLFALPAQLASPAQAQDGGPPPAVAPGTPSDGPPRWLEAWVGYFHTRSFDGGFGGGVMALNPERNLYANGGILRMEVGGGQYDPAVNTHGAAMMFGYRSDVSLGWLTAYGGTAYETHQNTEPGSRTVGTRGGLKAALEFTSKRFENIESYAIASYSTVFDTYFAFARTGLWIKDMVRIGPEAHTYGNVGYRDFKVGGFVELKLPSDYRLTFAGGYLHPLTDTDQDGVSKSQNGYYLNVAFNFWQ